MNKPPAFQFYAKDWITDTRELGTYGRGVLIDMIALCWENGSVPDDPYAVAESVGASVDVLLQPRFNRGSTGTPTGGQPEVNREPSLWLLLRSKFAVDPAAPGRLCNLRLEVEREKQAAFRVAQSAKGKASAESRAAARVQQRFNPGSTAVQPEGQPKVNSASASASAVFLEEDAAPATPPPPTKEKPKRKRRDPAPELPGATTSRDEFTAALAAASQGRYVDTPPTRGGAFKLDAHRSRPDALEVAARIGRWLAAGGDAWRGTMDGRSLGTDLDAWAAHSEAWERAGGGPVQAPARPQRAEAPAPAVEIRLPRGIA